MTLPLLSVIRLRSDRFLEEGVGAGAIGTIVEVYDDRAYEVEFSNPETGETIALFALPRDDVELVRAPTDISLSRAGD
ncbi:MAG: DUF4926 domain-containing protein [Thermomicrobiales bacterium]